MVKVGEKYRSKAQLPVRCWWWYDTVAILDDYSDNCEATLPAGTVFTVADIEEEDPTRILCKVEDEKRLKKLMVPKGRPDKSLFCRPRAFHVEINVKLIDEQCEPTMS